MRPRVRLVALSALCLCGGLLLTGCSLATYGLGVSTMVSDMKARQREDYARYLAEAESSHTKPLTFRQWVRGQDD